MSRWSNLSKGSAKFQSKRRENELFWLSWAREIYLNEWKNQIYLDFSRMQPTFTAQSDVKVLPFLVELLNHSK